MQATKGDAKRNYCFTYNNPKEDENTLIEQLGGVLKYLVMQREEGTEGTEHFQGYIELKKPMRVAALKKLCSKKIHWEARKGTRAEARDYCMKEDTRIAGPWEYGVWNGKPSTQGERSDLQTLSKRIDSGASIKEIKDEFPSMFFRYSRSIEKAMYLKAQEKPKLFRNVEVLIVYGKPGVGKTKLAYEHDPDLYAVPIGKDLWFDGYRGEKTLLLDDFSGQMKLVDLLRVLDGYPVQVPVKGAFVYLHCVEIIITTNVHPDYWYDYSQRADSLEALKRRVKHLIEIDEAGNPQAIDW